jgi:hypothetical protein
LPLPFSFCASWASIRGLFFFLKKVHSFCETVERVAVRPSFQRLHSFTVSQNGTGGGVGKAGTKGTGERGSEEARGQGGK